MKNYKLFLFLFFLWAVFGILAQSMLIGWTGEVERFLKYVVSFVFVVVVFSGNGVFKKVLFRLVLLLGLYISVLTIYFDHSHPMTCLNTIINACWWSYPPIVFYSITNKLQDKAVVYFQKYFTRLLIVEIVFFFVLQIIINRSKTQSNLIYWSALLLPFIFLIQNKKRRNYLIIFAVFFIIISFKRSAFLYGTFAILLIIVDNWKTSKNISNSVLFSIIMAIGIVTYVFYSENTTNTNSTLIRLEKGFKEGDSREDIYEIIWAQYLAKTPTEKIIGNGYRSTLFNNLTEDLGYSKTAHNDFLEILCDYGIVGSIMYILIIISFIKSTIKSRKFDRRIYLANLQCLATFFVMSMVSHLIIYPSYFAFLTAWWGINEGLQSNCRLKTIK